MKLHNTKIAKLCALALFGVSMQNIVVACEPAEQKAEQKQEVIDASKLFTLPEDIRAKITDFIDPVEKIAKLQGLQEWEKQEVGRHDGRVGSSPLSNVKSVGWSPDGNSIVSGGGSREVLVWKKQEDGSWFRQEVGRQDDFVTSVGWSPDGNSIVSGGLDKKVLFWTEQDDGSWSRQEVGRHDDWVTSVEWSPDGQSIVSGGLDKKVLFWTEQDDGSWSRQEVGRHDFGVRSVGWSPDGQSLVSGGNDCRVLIWDKQDDGSWSSQEVGRHRYPVRSVGWSPDGQSLVSGGVDKTIFVYNHVYTSKNLGALQKVLMLDVLAHVQAGKKMEFDVDHVKVYHTLPEKMKQLIEPFVTMQHGAAPLASGALEPRQHHVADDSRSPRGGLWAKKLALGVGAVATLGLGYRYRDNVKTMVCKVGSIGLGGLSKLKNIFSSQ